MAYNPLDLSGKFVLVTGASSGIGRATAQVISRLGAKVVLSGRREDALHDTRSVMERPELHPMEPFDLADIDAVPGWLKVVSNRHGPFDGVVHSAGMSATVPLRALGRSSMDTVMVPNVYAALALLRGASAKGVGSEGMSFVLLSSIAGAVGTPGLTAYSGSKGALEAIARSAAQELARKKIRVNCVAPGSVQTPMADTLSSHLPQENVAEVAARHLLGLLSPEEVAIAVAYLLSDASRRVTGTVLTIDSGYTS